MQSIRGLKNRMQFDPMLYPTDIFPVHSPQLLEHPMFSNFINHFFGNDNISSSGKKAKRLRGRTCRIEELENREMLSATPFDVNYDTEPVAVSPFVEVQYQGDTTPGSMSFVPPQEANASIGTPLTQAEFDTIRTRYADLGLSASMADYNIIVINANQLTEQNLRNAITQAGQTTGNDLIVLHTTATQNTITLTGTELQININATQRRKRYYCQPWYATTYY